MQTELAQAPSSDAPLKSGCGKLALGTVQWGMAYGIANRHGKAELGEVGRMLKLARSRGVSMLDTARAYGDAEEVIGAQDAAAQGFDIITKVFAERIDDPAAHDVAAAREAFRESLRRLRSTSVYGCLVHNAHNLLVPAAERLWDMLCELRSSGAVRKIGVSVYHPAQLEEILARYPIDLVQLPFNLYDQRFATSGLLEALEESRVEVHARSAFLQGLLLIPPGELPPRFESVREHQAHLHRVLGECGLTPLEGALQFSLARRQIDRVMVGVEKHDQLVELLAIAGRRVAALPASLDSFALTDSRILDPSTWSDATR